MSPCRPRALKQPAEKLTTGDNHIDGSRSGTPSEIGQKRDDSQTHQTVDPGAVKFGVGTKIKPNVIAGTFMLTQEMTAGTVLETDGVADICPTKTPAEVRPARIAEDPVLSAEDTSRY